MEEPVKMVEQFLSLIVFYMLVFLPFGEYLSNEFSFDEFGALLVFFLWKNFRLRSAFNVLCLVRCLLLGEDDDWNTIKYSGDNIWNESKIIKVLDIFDIREIILGKKIANWATYESTEKIQTNKIRHTNCKAKGNYCCHVMTLSKTSQIIWSKFSLVDF